MTMKTIIKYISRDVACHVCTLMFLLIFLLPSCNDYLDVVPEGDLATLENAFAMRSEAEKYLYTCYSYMPLDGTITGDPAILGGDEIWSVYGAQPNFMNDVVVGIARGYQNANSPLVNYWDHLYKGLRVCNIFLENIASVPDLPAPERIEWEGEVNFLKAYYHFYLLRCYGPIPLVKENLSIDAPSSEIRVSREPVDDCVDYIVQLLDTAVAKLPAARINPTRELGRATKLIAATLKAKVLVTAASPLFNGNNEQATLANRDGTKLFNPTEDISKWERAVAACKEALAICPPEVSLYQYNGNRVVSDTIKQELTIRNTVTEKWNSEIIWANTLTRPIDNRLVQISATAPVDKGRWPDQTLLNPLFQPPVKIAEMFYTSNGVPIEEDINWAALNPNDLRTGTSAGPEKYYIKNGYETIQLHFDREPRFYASLGFDGGMWYGQGRYDNEPSTQYYVAGRQGGGQQLTVASRGPVTGYYIKKLVHFESVQGALNNYTATFYPWPILRLADLYLLYAEAINEAEGPNGPNSTDLFHYIDAVREKNGLKGVKYSWDTYTSQPKYSTPNGMRQIIHRERLIELAFESQRFWDLRRWKEAPNEYNNKLVEGYKLDESDPEKFYKRVALWQQKFAQKDYFWPIKTEDIEKNPNLVQNIGW
ncbi:starch-binding protein [Bacteroidia bacterium]|nr:starch-binding protein [Bacteroidia bacterium]